MYYDHNPHQRYINIECAQNFHLKFLGLILLVLYLLRTYSKSSDVNICFTLIFTCVTSGFTYLELSPDMTSVSFINCFKILISRCGTPTKAVSDNFESFKSNETEAYFKKSMLHGNQYQKNHHGWVISTKGLQQY